MRMHFEALTDELLAPLLVESEHAFLPTKNHPDETAISLVEKFKRDEKYAALGYVLGSKAISYVIALSGRHDDEIAIGPMYVAKDFRGKGVGTEQIKDFIKHYADQSYDMIYTKTWMNNAASQHSFASTGFIEAGREIGNRIDGDTTISYVLHLDPQNQ